MIEDLPLLRVDNFDLFKHAPVLLSHSLSHLQTAFVAVAFVISPNQGPIHLKAVEGFKFGMLLEEDGSRASLKGRHGR